MRHPRCSDAPGPNESRLGSCSHVGQACVSDQTPDRFIRLDRRDPQESMSCRLQLIHSLVRGQEALDRRALGARSMT